MNWMISSMNFDSDIHREGEREGEKRGGEKRERGGKKGEGRVVYTYMYIYLHDMFIVSTREQAPTFRSCPSPEKLRHVDTLIRRLVHSRYIQQQQAYSPIHTIVAV